MDQVAHLRKVGYGAWDDADMTVYADLVGELGDEIRVMIKGRYDDPPPAEAL